MKVQFLQAETIKELNNADNLINRNLIGNGTFVFCYENERLYIIMKNKLIGITPSKDEIEKRKKRRVNCCNCGGLLPKQEDSYSSIIECPYCGSVQDIEDIVTKDY